MLNRQLNKPAPIPPGHIELSIDLCGLGPDGSALENELRHYMLLAADGLRNMYRGDGTFVHTMRASPGDPTRRVSQVGSNQRYGAIVALGLNRTSKDVQERILQGGSARDLALRTTARAVDSDDIGAVALSAWAAAEVGGRVDPKLFKRISDALDSLPGLETVACAWILSAAIAAASRGGGDDLCRLAARKLIGAQAASGLFPHRLSSPLLDGLRAHVGCYADQVYPIQALARHFERFGDKEALAAANACAARICDLQGAAGQWWWHYDVRTGTCIEGYPVYSVHQHAMGPMALLELRRVGGRDHLRNVALGLSWLTDPPETRRTLVCEQQSVIWRKVGRRDPAKLVRKLSTVASALRPGLRLHGVNGAYPPVAIDFECRPYEFGWLFYAWLSGEDPADPSARNVLMTPHPSASGAPRQKNSIFGLQIDPLDMDEIVAHCQRAIENRAPVLLGMLNAAKVVKLRSSPPLRNALLNCDLLLADGQSVVWASRLLHLPLPARVAGIDIFIRLLAAADEAGQSVYLLGARPEVLDDLKRALAQRHPNLRVAGSQHGYFSEVEEGRIVDAIAASGADMLFVGMTSPRKELFLSRNRHRLNVPVMHGVGGSFDLLAGRTRRAPESWQRLGLEWAFRVAQEPRRMWRRYLTTNTLFLLLLARELVRRSPTLKLIPPAGEEPFLEPDLR